MNRKLRCLVALLIQIGLCVFSVTSRAQIASVAWSNLWFSSGTPILLESNIESVRVFLVVNCRIRIDFNQSQWQTQNSEVRLILRPYFDPGAVNCGSINELYRTVFVANLPKLQQGRYDLSIVADLSNTPPEGFVTPPSTFNFPTLVSPIEVVEILPDFGLLRVLPTRPIAGQIITLSMFQTFDWSCLIAHPPIVNRQNNQVEVLIRLESGVCILPPSPSEWRIELGVFDPGNYSITVVKEFNGVRTVSASANFKVVVGSNNLSPVPSMNEAALLILFLSVLIVGWSAVDSKRFG